MSPNTRKRKSRIAEHICKTTQSYSLSVEDQINIMSHSLRKLGIYKNFISQNNQSTLKDRKFTNYAARKVVWHSESIASTLKSCPTKLCITNKNQFQSGLDFVETNTIEKQRNNDFVSVTGILLLSHLSNYFKSMLQLTLII